MFSKWLSLTLGMMIVSASAGAASAAHWLKVDPNDPFQNEGGRFHMMDVEGIVQHAESGLIVGRFAFVTPAQAARDETGSPFIWVFDCKKNQVFFANEGGGAQTTSGWRAKPTDLGQPHMGGITNTMSRKLCALSGSWPAGPLPP